VQSHEEYLKMHQRSLADPEGFWGELAKEHLTWSKPFTSVKSGAHTYETTWFAGGELNACYNAVDRHLEKRGDKVAILWESDDGKEVKKITYRQLHAEVQKAANALKDLGVTRSSHVTLYLPMIPEAIISMLACARLGVPHNNVFAGFSEAGLADRITASKSEFVITADEMLRGGKALGLKAIVDGACKRAQGKVKKVMVVRRTGGEAPMQEGRDVWWHEALAKASPTCPPVPVKSEEELFCLFTSGSSGKPKGLVHQTGGYLTYAAVTTKYGFDLKEDDIYACMADIGWVRDERDDELVHANVL
jgi:acetyl-CoA synthetase